MEAAMKTLGREARTLVDAARGVAPTAADRERIRHKLHARVGIGIAAGAAAALAPKSAAAATAGATKAIGAGLLSSVGVGVLVGVMATGAAWVWDLPGSAPGAGPTPEKAMGAPAKRTPSS